METSCMSIVSLPTYLFEGNYVRMVVSFPKYCNGTSLSLGPYFKKGSLDDDRVDNEENYVEPV